jgi:rhomboid protease GluP
VLGRQTSGSVVCPTCGKLVGVADAACWNCGRPHPGMWGYAAVLRRLGRDLGFVEIVTGAAALLYLATLVADTSGIGFRGLQFLSPSRASLIVFGAAGPGPVLLADRWWTLLSAGWLHGSLIHIAFNLMWIRQLAPATAALYGPGRMVIVYTLSSVAGFAASSVLAAFAPGLVAQLMGGGHPQGITIGASAAIFGLLGALVHAGRRGSSEIGNQAWGYAIILFAFGLFLDGVDNWAHLGGFVGVWGAALALDPRKPERGDHLLAALLCLLLSAAAIVASFVTGQRLLGG